MPNKGSFVRKVVSRGRRRALSSSNLRNVAATMIQRVARGMSARPTLNRRKMFSGKNVLTSAFTGRKFYR